MPLHPSLRFADPATYARRTVEAHAAALAGGSPADVDSHVLAAWRRSDAAGVSPDQEQPAQVLTRGELAQARETTPLQDVAGDVLSSLADTSAAGRHLVVLTDARGVLLWRSGSGWAMRGADSIAFAEGADWSETGIGTNGISRALETGGLSHVTAGEHFVRAHHTWTCSAAPIRDPCGGIAGVLDISLPVRFATAECAALVRCGVRLAEAPLAARLPPADRDGSPARGRSAELGPVTEIRLLGWRPEVVRADGSRTPLTARRAELLALLASRAGWTARALAEALYGDGDAATTVRGEVRRLRRQTGLTIRSQPYALAEAERARVDFLTGGDALELLPDSDVPAIVDLRYGL